MNKTISKFALAVLVALASAVAQETAATEAAAATETATATDTAQAKPAEKEKADTAQLMKRRYGIRGGVNWSSLGWRSVAGFQAGGAGDIPLALVDIKGYPYTIGLQPSAYFISKGGKYRYRYYNVLYYYYYYNTITAYYAQASLPVSFGRAFSKNFAARVELGPYFALGLFGTNKGDGVNESAFSDEGLSRIDAGMYSGVAMEFFGRKYYLGMHNSSGFTDDNISVYCITLGYNF